MFEVSFFRIVQRCIKSDLRPYVPDVLIVYVNCNQLIGLRVCAHAGLCGSK